MQNRNKIEQNDPFKRTRAEGVSGSMRENAAHMADVDTTPAPITLEPSSAITTHAGTNSIVLAGVIGVTAHGIIYDSALLTKEMWQAFYTMLERVKSARSWMLADYFRIGADEFEIPYATLSTDYGMTPKSVEVYASIGRNVPELIRIKSPSFAHARLVSSLPVEYQEYWINRAVEGAWSVALLRNEMARAAGKRVKEKKSPARLSKQERVAAKVRNDLAAIPRSERAAFLRSLADEIEQKG